VIAGKGHETYQILGKRKYTLMITRRPAGPWMRGIKIEGGL
jgi:hypothetical protein